MPGAVAVSAELWERVRGGCGGAHASDAVPQKLKGVSEPVMVCNVWPAALSGRESTALSAPTFPKSFTSNSVSSHRSSLRGSPLLAPTTYEHATVGVTTLCCSSILSINDGLNTVLASLEQCSGSLLSVVGDSFLFGWNVGHHTSSHVECALLFAARVHPASNSNISDTSTLVIASGRIRRCGNNAAALRHNDRSCYGCGAWSVARVSGSKCAVPVHIRNSDGCGAWAADCTHGWGAVPTSLACVRAVCFRRAEGEGEGFSSPSLGHYAKRFPDLRQSCTMSGWSSSTKLPCLGSRSDNRVQSANKQRWGKTHFSPQKSRNPPEFVPHRSLYPDDAILQGTEQFLSQVAAVIKGKR